MMNFLGKTPLAANQSVNQWLTRSQIENTYTADVYTDLNGLQNIKSMEDKDAALRKVTQQFESMFLHLMMKSMRDANSAFEEGSLFSSNESKFFRDMYDQQLSVTLANGKQGGIGIADAMYRQMKALHAPKTSSLQSQLLNKSASQSQSFSDVKPAVTQKRVFAETPKEFVEKVAPIINKAACELGVDAEVLLAQTALETGWGQHVICHADGTPSYNLFNIKASSDWCGDKVAINTLEYDKGTFASVLANFKSYSSVNDSVKDYVALIKNSSRYAQAQNKDAEAYLNHLHKAGYATDPQYVEKIMSIRAQLKSEFPSAYSHPRQG